MNGLALIHGSPVERTAHNRLRTPLANPLNQLGGCVIAATIIPITVTINGCVVLPSVVAVLRIVTTVPGSFSIAAGDATIAPAMAIAVATAFVILFCVDTSCCIFPPFKYSSSSRQALHIQSTYPITSPTEPTRCNCRHIQPEYLHHSPCTTTLPALSRFFTTHELRYHHAHHSTRHSIDHERLVRAVER